jgi:transposase
MTTVQLSEAEIRILKQYKRKVNLILIQAKSEAILLLNENVDISIVARFVDREVSTVEEWAKQFNKTRLGSIATGHQGNLNASYLTASQKAEILQVLSQPPSDHGLDEQFWTVKDLADQLRIRFQIVYESPESYHFLFTAAGLSFHKPEPFDKRRGDEEEISQRIAQIRSEVTAELKADPSMMVLTGDEVRLDQEAVVRRAWYKKNTKTKMKVNRQREYQNYIGFLNQADGHCDLFRLDWQNGTLVLEALERLLGLYPDKKIVLIWDNASWHKTKVIRDELGQGGKLERVHLIAMPPYAPDYNPIEHVWKDAKETIANWQADSFDETRTAFESHISSRSFNYKL